MTRYRDVTVPTSDVLPLVDAALREHFHQDPERASVSFVGVEPIEVLRFEPVPGEHAYVSLGTSGHPMTPADTDIRSEHGPRAELMMQVRQGFGDVWRQLAVLAAAPAVEGVVYAPGMTIDLGIALAPGSGCTGGVIAPAPIPDIAVPQGAVQILQVLAATPTELAFARVHGADALLARWAERHTPLSDLGRRAVELT